MDQQSVCLNRVFMMESGDESDVWCRLQLLVTGDSYEKRVSSSDMGRDYQINVEG